MPPNTVKVDRSTKWGNPFVVHDQCNCGAQIGEQCRRPRRLIHVAIHVATAAEAVECFRAIPRSPDELRQIREQLGGKNPACFCPLDQPCHADVWLEIANG